jgi:hypothetical protein
VLAVCCSGLIRAHRPVKGYFIGWPHEQNPLAPAEHWTACLTASHPPRTVEQRHYCFTRSLAGCKLHSSLRLQRQIATYRGRSRLQTSSSMACLDPAGWGIGLARCHLSASRMVDRLDAEPRLFDEYY